MSGARTVGGLLVAPRLASVPQLMSMRTCADAPQPTAIGWRASHAAQALVRATAAKGRRAYPTGCVTPS